MANTSPAQPIHSDALDTNKSHAGIGLSDPQLIYEVRKKLDAMNKLHSTGVQIDIDLPQIAVIGSQSAGKSSLIESISGITLPRAAGTCTRCPMECRLSRTEGPWQCIVSLRFTTNSAGQPLGQARNEQFGDVIYNKSKVEERIRRAQRAILNPHKKQDSFLDDPDARTDSDPSQLTFSMNCVTLQISGPDVADLSFCDLPGLIASVSGGTNNSITLVENLVTSYIKKPSCIILLTVACETDFENQGAHRLAKQYDPEGKRTIGVLTKPDRIPVGEEHVWLPFIRDEKEQLENNWFCVKQPSSNELKLKMTWSQARKMEHDFFSSKSPWSTLEDTYQRYLKTGNLVERLSNVLYDLIETRMPQIQDELDRSIANTRESLARLPSPPTSDPRSEILTLLHKFSQDLALQIEGVPDGVGSQSELGLIQAVRPEQERFKRAIRSTAPNFSPFESSSSVNKQLPVAEFLRSEEGNELDLPNAQLTSQAQDGSGRTIYIDEVLESAHRARTRELPGHYPFVVQKTFIQNIVKQWNTPSETLCQSTHAIMLKHAKHLVQKHFEYFGQGRLAQQVRLILQQHINECLMRAEERVKWLLRLEEVPFSLNTHYLADYRDKFLAYYKGAREKHLQMDLAKTASAIETPVSLPASFPQAPTKPFQWTPISFPSVSKSNTPVQESPMVPRMVFGAKTLQTQTQAAVAPSSASVSAAPLATALPVTIATTSSSATPIINPFASAATTAAIGQSQMQTALNKVLSGLAEMGMTGVKAEDLPKLLPPDRMEPALVIMADVRAYFQVAYKRFADNVPLAIDVELVRGIETEILSILYAKLGINGPNGDAICKELAHEGRKIADRRRDLTKKLERLESARLELFTI